MLMVVERSRSRYKIMDVPMVSKITCWPGNVSCGCRGPLLCDSLGCICAFESNSTL